MVNCEPPSPALDSVFQALADPTRRAILRRLSTATATVGELQAVTPSPMTAPALSKHLRVLEGAGLLRQERQGRHRVCRLVPDALHPAEVWMAETRRFWTRRLDELEDLLRAPTEGDHDT